MPYDGFLSKTASGQAPQAQAPRLTSFPTRPQAPPEVLERGKAAFSVSCAFCHGSDAGGGEVGPNLKRSGVVLEDKDGELIEPIVHGSRQAQGMPRIELTNAQISDIAAWLHSLAVTARTDPNAEKISTVTGNVSNGQAYFQKICSSCHSTTGDLAGFASKFTDPKMMQQWWLMPGSGARGSGPVGPPAGLHLPPKKVVVSLKSGERIQGTLNRMDDFYVYIDMPDGSTRGIDRLQTGAAVVVKNPLQPHLDLLKKYTDKDIHDVTAYLETLK